MRFLGFVVFGLFGVGVVGLFLAFYAVDRESAGTIGAGICLVASALSFGLLLNALLKIEK